MAKYAMVIDLNKCVRCRTCYVSCKKEHGILAHPKDNIHKQEYSRLIYAEWEYGKFPTVERAFISLHCMHCENPVCLTFCHAGAITQGSDGIIRIDKESCNGCGLCAGVCPYGVIYIGPDGKADVCDFCADRLEKGLLPKCVETCPAQAILFGLQDDKESSVYSLINSGKARPLLCGSIKSTGVYYIPSAHEPEWEKMELSNAFLSIIEKRKDSMPPIQGTTV